MQRVAVIGSGGAGKSTLARGLGAILGIAVVHLDRLYWQPGWVATDAAEWKEVQRLLIARDRWILDGHYGGTLDLRLAAADTVIFLDMPRVVCVVSIVRRWLRCRGRRRPDGAVGCPERITWEFLRWVWHYPKVHRPRMLAKLAQHADGRRIVILRNRVEVRGFLERLRSASPPTRRAS